MQIVSFPPELIDHYLSEVRALLESGSIAEGRYFYERGTPFVEGRYSVPVSSGGAGLLCLLAFHRETQRRSVAIVQSNTMRALYTVPRLLGMTPMVAESSYEDFMAMNPASLERLLEERSVAQSAVVVYSVIGGYLAPSFRRIQEICRHARVPLVVDGAHAHYLDALLDEREVDIVYSFYATKVLPAGEGGLVVSDDEERVGWVRRFLTYDRFANELEIGINLRTSELGAALIHRLMTDPALARHFKGARLSVANRYITACRDLGIRYLVPGAAVDYNGYKFIVLDSREDVAALGTPLTEHPATSGVFDTDVLGRPTVLPHWCPPTYSSLGSTAP